jgi:hypothetical protein
MEATEQLVHCSEALLTITCTCPEEPRPMLLRSDRCLAGDCSGRCTSLTSATTHLASRADALQLRADGKMHGLHQAIRPSTGYAKQTYVRMAASTASPARTLGPASGGLLQRTMIPGSKSSLGFVELRVSPVNWWVLLWMSIEIANLGGREYSLVRLIKIYF